MDTTSFTALLATYWSASELTTNLIIFMNLLGALLLGALVGYERAYHGRAAGMRTYGLVCMASAGLTVIAGYPALWYGGSHTLVAATDPTRVMQGIVTGIGFLGAGVIVKEGLSISGLTTAASIWAASCIGVLIGVGFYAAAILLAGLCAMTMMWGSKIENWLPSHHAVAVQLNFKVGHTPDLDTMQRFAAGQGYEVARGSVSVSSHSGRPEWRFVVVVLDRLKAAPLDVLARELQALDGVEGFALTHARN
jgi:putative Mg2+ transporter-C (MgtC) family protein